MLSIVYMGGGTISLDVETVKTYPSSNWKGLRVLALGTLFYNERESSNVMHFCVPGKNHRCCVMFKIWNCFEKKFNGGSNW